MHLKFGLQTKIILLVVCGLATVFAAFTYLALQTLDESTQRSLAERLAVANMIASHSDEHVSHAIAELAAVAQPEILLSFGPAQIGARERVADLYNRSALSDFAVFIADYDGRVVWSNPDGKLAKGQTLPAFDSISPDLHLGRPQVSDLALDPATRAPIALLAVPVLDENRRVIGVVGSAADLSTGRLATLVEKVTMGRTGYAEVVDRNGRVLASTLGDRLFLKDDHADRFNALILKREPVVGRCHRCHEPESTASSRQNDVLAFSPMHDAPWGIALRQLEEEVLAPTREMSKRVAYVAVPLFAFALAAAWFTTSRVVRPIRSLTVASDRIAKGDLDFGVQPFGKDELGALAAAFESMRVKLRASYSEIEAWNRELEHRVEQRTRDLASVFEASQVVSSTLDLETLLHALVPRLVELVRQAGAGALFLKSDDDDCLVARSSHRYDQAAVSRLRFVPGEGIPGKVFRSKHPILWPDAAAIASAMADLSPSNAEVWPECRPATPPVAATVGAPLIAQGRAIGCLILDCFDRQQGFAEADLSLVQTIADRIAAGIENARLYEELQRKEQLRGQLLEKVIVAQEDERRRIARELHDETGQSLTALAISLASAQDAMPPGAVGANNALLQAKALAEKLLSETRRLISDLRPTVLDDLGLVPALRRHVTARAETLGLDIQLQVEGRRHRLLPQAETTLFRVVQEALTNAAKHAHAEHIVVTLAFEQRRVVAEVRDDGRGFDVAQAMSATGAEQGMGLLGMRERATLLGGALDIVSGPGEGTRLIVALPLEHQGVFTNEFADKGSAS